MRDFNNNDISGIERSSVQNFSNAEKKEMEFKLKIVQEELDSLRKENEAQRYEILAKSSVGNTPKDNEEIERLKKDVEMQVYKNKTLEQGNIGLIKDNRTMKEEVNNMMQKIREKEQLTSEKEKEFMTREEKMKKEIEEFSIQYNPFNTINKSMQNPFDTINQTINQTQIGNYDKMKVRPLEPIVENNDENEENYDNKQKIEELAQKLEKSVRENDVLKKELIKVKVERQVDKSMSQIKQVEVSLNQSRLNESKIDTRKMDKSRQSQISHLGSEDERQRIASLYAEVADYKQKCNL